MARHMENGVWYDLVPPSIIGGKRFPKVMCVSGFPLSQNDYLVSGVPEGEAMEEYFILRFTTDKGVVVMPSDPPSHMHEMPWN